MLCLYDKPKEEGFMITKIVAVIAVAVFIIAGAGAVSFAADQNNTAATAAQKTAHAMPMPAKANFAMIAGTVTTIDTKDPANIKLTVKNDADNTTHIVTVTPWTNITKVTDVSELKTDEPIRMMTRKVEDKEVAMGIMFGKIKAMPPIKAQAAQPQQSAPVKAKN